MLLRSLARSAALLLAAAPFLALSGCDNPACVFGGDCSGGGSGGAIGTLNALAPEDHQIVKAERPVLQRMLPNGANTDPRTPIAIVFSEAMSTATLSFAFELSRVGIGSLPLATSSLVGDGRVLVLFPATELMPGDYQVLYRENVQVGDRNGQEVQQPTDRVVGGFTVPATAPTLPELVLHYPDLNESGLPDTTEIVTIFSRPMNPGTFTDAAFDVTVDGAPPPFDALAEPLTLGVGLSDARVFRWISRDSMGERASLGLEVDVEVSLSSAGSELRDSTGEILTPETFDFATLPFPAPVSASLTSFPTDAIGVNQLTDPADLAINVMLAGAQAGDRLGAFVFGTQPEDVEAPLTIALFREVELDAAVPSFTFTAAELNLVRTSSPLTARVRDGEIQFAFRLKRGNLESPVRRLDVDLLEERAQGPVLDTVPPVLMRVGSAVNPAEVDRTDVAGLSLWGVASEELRAALVETTSGSNETVPGTPPPVAGSDPATGMFLAAPVDAGLLNPPAAPVNYTLTIFDRAMNSGGSAMGELQQVGAASGGLPPPFVAITVSVFDASTLLPISGATIYAHEDFLGSVSEIASATTPASGTTIIPASAAARTLITVSRAGYDLFTFDGVPSDALGVPLVPSGATQATSAGVLASQNPQIGATPRAVADSRMPRPGEAFASVGSCATDPMQNRIECPFGPFPVTARQIGGASGISFFPPPNPAVWSAGTFLLGFGLRVPLPALEPGAAGITDVELETFSLSNLEEFPLDVVPHSLNTVAWPMLSGAPRVVVEGIVPGVPRPLPVGSGVAFELGPDSYLVRAAYPGAADTVSGTNDALGRFVAQGTLEPRLFLRAEVVTPSGARAADRPNLATSDLSLAPPNEPVLGAPPIAANLGEGFDVSFLDVLRDSAGQGGIHRATVVDASGLRWSIWRIDEPDIDGPDVVVHLPELGGLFPLASGAGTVRISSWSWTAFDESAFLWTDVEREAERYAHSAAQALTIP